jgi:F-type H+-transporting ATPase subunit delta
MAIDDSRRAGLARLWSDALSALAAEAGREDELLAELEELVDLLDRQPELERLLANPLVDDQAKRQLVERAFRERASDLLVDTLQVMRRKGRLDLVRALAVAYRRDWMRRRNRIEVRVASPVPLGEELRTELRLALAERTNRHPVLVERVRPELLGGLVVEIGDLKFDASVARELAKLEEALLQRASRELHAGKSYSEDSA